MSEPAEETSIILQPQIEAEKARQETPPTVPVVYGNPQVEPVRSKFGLRYDLVMKLLDDRELGTEDIIEYATKLEEFITETDTNKP